MTDFDEIVSGDTEFLRVTIDVVRDYQDFNNILMALLMEWVTKQKRKPILYRFLEIEFTYKFLPNQISMDHIRDQLVITDVDIIHFCNATQQ